MTKKQQASGDREPWEKEKASGGYPECAAESLELHEGAEGAGRPKFDLEERTAKFGEAIIHFAKKIPQNPVNNRLIAQLVGCGTSVGANYCEADDAVSKKEFLNKIGTCRKEGKETKFFLRMAAQAEPSLAEEARRLWREANELHLIFCAIMRKGKEDP
ncbi:MAG: four helix bundle protein [Verrucomicrobia bacterium]|nr:four helix bundle protein [Verrucomicrobiota bacterium]